MQTRLKENIEGNWLTFRYTENGNSIDIFKQNYIPTVIPNVGDIVFLPTTEKDMPTWKINENSNCNFKVKEIVHRYGWLHENDFDIQIYVTFI